MQTKTNVTMAYDLWLMAMAKPMTYGSWHMACGLELNIMYSLWLVACALQPNAACCSWTMVYGLRPVPYELWPLAQGPWPTPNGK